MERFAKIRLPEGTGQDELDGVQALCILTTLDGANDLLKASSQVCQFLIDQNFELQGHVERLKRSGVQDREVAASLLMLHETVKVASGEAFIVFNALKMGKVLPLETAQPSGTGNEGNT